MFTADWILKTVCDFYYVSRYEFFDCREALAACAYLFKHFDISGRDITRIFKKADFSGALADHSELFKNNVEYYLDIQDLIDDVEQNRKAVQNCRFHVFNDDNILIRVKNWRELPTLTLRILNDQQKVFANTTVQNKGTIKIPTGELASGIYTILLKAGKSLLLEQSFKISR
ncbi:MAG TPA: hypothetical protein VEC36_00285 [Patescibacteria group bacterium]|nr:hypothetical protein [Patescibacteria group bacterium]